MLREAWEKQLRVTLIIADAMGASWLLAGCDIWKYLSCWCDFLWVVATFGCPFQIPL
jgi:hypothetical protein